MVLQTLMTLMQAEATTFNFTEWKWISIKPQQIIDQFDSDKHRNWQATLMRIIKYIYLQRFNLWINKSRRILILILWFLTTNFTVVLFLLLPDYLVLQIIPCLVVLELYLPVPVQFCCFFAATKDKFSSFLKKLFHSSTLHTYHHNSSCSFR